MKTKKSVVFLDLEAKQGPEEVGGWDMISKMGLGLAVTLEMPDGELRIFEEDEVAELVKLLNAADWIIGFNCDRFHFPVLRGLVGKKFRPKSSRDLLVEFLKAAGHRITLETLIKATFGVERESRPQPPPRKQVKIIQSLCQNVLDLERLHRHLIKTGSVFFRDRQGKRVKVQLGRSA